MPRVATDFNERFFSHVEKTDTCWLWKGNSWTPNGYAIFDSRVAHKVIYERLNGPVPAGLELDHICKIRHCVNPEHLEIVTHAENNRRSDSPSGVNSRKTHCIHGHNLEGSNLYVTPNGRRQCKTCIANRSAKAYMKRKEIANA